MHPSDEGDAAPQREMPRYVSHKKVWALEISDITDFQIHFKEAGYASVPRDEAMFSRYQPVPGDFYVVYADGYKSFSPRKAFLEGYTRDLPPNRGGLEARGEATGAAFERLRHLGLRRVDDSENSANPRLPAQAR